MAKSAAQLLYGPVLVYKLYCCRLYAVRTCKRRINGEFAMDRSAAMGDVLIVGCWCCTAFRNLSGYYGVVSVQSTTTQARQSNDATKS